METELPASVICEGAAPQEAVTIRQLSLGGAFLSGISPGDCGKMLIRVPLPSSDVLGITAELVRAQGNGAAVRFQSADMETLTGLWSYIRDFIPLGGACPYCNQKNGPLGFPRCRKCGRLLAFQDDNYLKNHIKETFSERIMHRAKGFDAAQMLRMLSLMDKKPSQTKEAAANEPTQDLNLKNLVASTKKDLVLKALAENRFTISRAAKALSISRPTLYSLIDKYGIEFPKGKYKKGDKPPH